MVHAPAVITTRSSSMPVGIKFGLIGTKTDDCNRSHEILQEIAVYLPDKDLKSFSLVQRAARDAVIPANAGHWRQRFRDQYDLPPGKSPAAIKKEYTFRRCYLTHRIRLKYGQSSDEIACLQAIRQLIVEVPHGLMSSSSLELDASPSLNVRQLWRFMKKSNLLHDAFRWTRPKRLCTNRLLEIVQVFFFSWNVYYATHDLPEAYPFALRLTSYSMDESEALALAPSNRNLVNAGGQIDFSALSHLTNLWKFHLAINDVGGLQDILSQLPSSHYPKTCFEQSVRAVRRSERWKGALFHPCGGMFHTFLTNGVGSSVHADPYFTGGDRLLSLTFQPVGESVLWPKAFEQAIQGTSSPGNDDQPTESPVHLPPFSESADKTSKSDSTKVSTAAASGARAYHSLLPRNPTTKAKTNVCSSDGETTCPTTNAGKAAERLFVGLGEYDVNLAPLNVASAVDSLPPQCGILGWQRFTMVSYETPASGSKQKGYLDAKDADLYPYLHYEGVMLPGESIIIGRYSMGDDYRNDDDPDQFLQRGTFIYWLAHDDASDDEDNEGGYDDGDAEAEEE
ncbi:MAG: hypothetical protein Q9226_003629 [Calogaya cf. arnoldii]